MTLVTRFGYALRAARANLVDSEVKVAGNGEKWRWADPQGTQRVVHFDELRAALASGALPPYTLVWRRGMPEWQPAHLVGELATAAISAQQGVIPNVPPPPLHIVAVQAEFERRGDQKRKDTPSDEPPPPPVHQYAALAAGSPPRAAAIAKGLAVTPRTPPVSARPATVSAEPAPRADDDDDDEGVLKTLVARPVTVPAAAQRLAPPPRKSHPVPSSLAPPPPTPRRTIPGPGMPRSALAANAPPIAVPPPHSMPPSGPTKWPPFSDEPDDAVPRAPAMPTHTALAGAENSGSLDDELPSFPLEDLGEPSDPLEPSGASLVRDTQPPKPVDPDAGLALRQQLVQRARWFRRRVGPAVRRASHAVRTHVVPTLRRGAVYLVEHRRDPRVIAGAGTSALLLAFIIGTSVASSGRANPDTPVHSGVSSGASQVELPAPADGLSARGEAPAAPPDAVPAACRSAGEATRLATKASKDAPIELAVASRGDRAWLGFASDAASARGLVIDLSTGSASQEFAGRAGKVRAVVPVPTKGRAVYAVNADGHRDRLQAWRTVPSDPPQVVGWSDHGVAVARRATDAPRVVFGVEGGAPPDVFRVVLAGEREVIAMRRDGGIWLGQLGAGQVPQGELVRVEGAGAPAGSPVGTPALATNGPAVAVAFADRASPAEPWSIRMASAPIGELPAQSSPMRLPEGGPGGAALAPALAGLDDGRWLMVWTEGSGGQHEVRALTLGADLTPLGAPFAVSRHDDNAGQGAVAVSAGRGFVAYLSLTDRGYELWGTGVDCR